MRFRRRRATVGLLLLGLMLVTPVTAFAQAPANIGSYVSYGYGSGVHTISGTSAFPNFQNGAVDNRYPLTQVEQDASPSSDARASYADTGPAAATVGSQYNQSCSAGNPPPPPSACSNPNNGVPYANSNYPGGPQSAHVDACSSSSGSAPGQCPGSQASSDSSELGANASGTYAGGGTQPFSGASGESHTVVTADGMLRVWTHSEVQNFVIGTFHVSKVVVETIATATNSSASADATVVVGSVTFNGQPVAVTDQGVTLEQKTPVPCPGTPGGGGGGTVPVPSPPVIPSAPALPGDHEGCLPGVDITYIQVFTVDPSKTVSGTHGTAQASGLHIRVTHPTPGPGVPQQYTEYVLGEGYSDASTGNGGGGFGAGDFGFGGGDFGFSGGPGADNGGAGVAAGVVNAVFSNRWWPLVLLFLTLEALLLGSAAAWVWARNAPVDEIADEVLVP
jgi:hypothetical protein